MKDPEIISFLQQTRQATFFSRDRDFFHKHHCHASYCLVHLDVKKSETAFSSAASYGTPNSTPDLNAWAKLFN
jgi:hypothetical protein